MAMGKVLFVTLRFCGGGAERALSNIVTHFPPDWDIDIMVDDESLIGYPYRGNILSLATPEKASRISYLKTMIKRTYYLRKIKKTKKYDACISFLESANISNVLSGNRSCKTVVSIRNQVMPKQAGLYNKAKDFFFTKLLFCHADTIVTVSEEIALELTDRLKIPGCKVRAIVNGYDCGWIRNQIKLYSPEDRIEKYLKIKDKKVVVTAGRLVKQKGQWHLIRAFSEIIKKEPQAKLFILGEGPLESYLKNIIHIYGLEKEVILTGRVDNPFWYYSVADIFVFPSLWEGYPNALAEAVCCGAPCIATDVHSGSREILAPALYAAGERVKDVSEEEYGILVPVCSGRMYEGRESLEPEEQKLSEAIGMLLSDDKKREDYHKKSKERSKGLDIYATIDKWKSVIAGS